jgi:hypothetical protein
MIGLPRVPCPWPFAVIPAILAALLATAAVSVMAQAPTAGQASGSVTVDGKSMKIAHAYAWAQPNPFDSGKTDVRDDRDGPRGRRVARREAALEQQAAQELSA